METGKYWTVFGKGNVNGLDMMDICTKLLKSEWKVNLVYFCEQINDDDDDDDDDKMVRQPDTVSRNQFAVT